MQSKESDINEIMEQIVQFSEDRDWDQFHNGKDLALALSIEASELNEAFLWKSAEDVKIDKIKEELADIINYAFLIAYKYNLDIYNPQNEMFRLLGTKRSFSQNETFFFSHPYPLYPALFRLISHF